MDEYIIHTEDLNSSLVFYRALFNKMPDSLNAFEFVFKLKDFVLRVRESQTFRSVDSEPFHFRTEKIQLKKVYHKMRRFARLNQFKENCVEPGESIGLTDPDGQKWVIGEYREDLSFEKCYINF